MPKPTTQTNHSDANFDDLFGTSKGEGLLSGLKLVAIERIQTAAQPRTLFDSQALRDLSHSIAALRERGEGVEGTGILQPLLVTREGEDYRLLAGERRLRAAKLTALPEVPVIEVSSREDTRLAVQLVENLQRAGLNPLDEARSLRHLMSEQKLSIRDAATLLGKTRGYVTNRLDLLKMGDDVQQMVSSREDTLRVAAHIERVAEPEKRAELIRAVLEEGMGEREIKRRIEGSPSPPETQIQVSSREDTSRDDAPKLSDNSPSQDAAATLNRTAKSLGALAAQAQTGHSLTDEQAQKCRAQLQVIAAHLETLREKWGE